jgi:hypothetical protein
VLTSKPALLIGGYLTLTAVLVGCSGIAGESAANALLLAASMAALVMARGPREPS